MAAPTSRPVVLCVDVEPDERFPASGHASWSGYHARWGRLCRERARLADATGAPVCWSWFFRMDPQAQAAAGSRTAAAGIAPERLDAMRTAGDSIGVHMHPLRAEGSGWAIDFADDHWVDDCVRSSIEAFRAATGEGCRSFRFGDRWLDGRRVRLLESLGVRVDLSVEPGHFGVPGPVAREPHRGTWPDAERAPRGPYRPSYEDAMSPDSGRRRGLLELPVTTVWKDGPWKRRRRALKFHLFPATRRNRSLSLDLSLPPPLFRTALERAIRVGGGPLVLVLRTDRPRGSGDDPIELNFAMLRSAPRIAEFRFETAEAVASRYEPR